MTTATPDTPAPAETADALEVVMAFPTVDAYRAMGDLLAKARTKLGLPTSSTPTEVIAAALREQAGTG
ncbi:MAG TPA: hypothetical protein VNL97_07500 [Solirubrobacterales bacterium]|nr:hypothetical protein [Solirubrobacterales bacterium]